MTTEQSYPSRNARSSARVEPRSQAMPQASGVSSVQATFEGEPIEAPAGASIAAALIASDRIAWRSTRDGAQRGLFCGIGVCFDCLVEVDGESGQRACMIPLQEGMKVCAAKGPNAEPKGGHEDADRRDSAGSRNGAGTHDSATEDDGTSGRANDTHPEQHTSQQPGHDEAAQ